MNAEDTWARLKRDVRSLLMASKIGLDPDELQKEHLNMLGCPLPLNELGFKNVMDMVKEMPDVVQVHTRHNGRIYFRGVSDESTKHIQELVNKQRISKADSNKLARLHHTPCHPPRYGRSVPPLPFHLKSQLCSLLSHGPIHLLELRARFLHYYRQPLNVLGYGYSSVNEMMEAAADCIQICNGSVLVLKEHMRPRQVYIPAACPSRIRPIKPSVPVKCVSKPTDTRGQTVQGTVKKSSPSVPSAVKPCPESNRTQSDLRETVNCDEGAKQVAPCAEPPLRPERYEYAPTAADGGKDDVESTCNSKAQGSTSEVQPASQTCGSSAVPSDAMQSQRLKQPTRHSVRQMMTVHVEHIESPGHFYVRFFETAEAKALESMMLEMRRCYSCREVSARYRLLPQFVRRGQVCCVSPSRMWFYRAVIQQVISSTQVEVYYVDFGNTAVVQSSNLRFLKSCYSDLPAQAVPSSLAGITATSGSWSAEAIMAFMVLCNDRTVVGALDCYVGDVLQLYLCDTRTKDDVYIHSVLLSQGHGKACNPATSAVHCVRVTPVGLYLGEGAIDFPEVEVDTSSPSELADVLQEPSSPSVEETIPPLECIDDYEASFNILGTQHNQFSTAAPLNNQVCSPRARNCWSWMDAVLPSAPSSSQPLPDVTQTGTPPSAYGVNPTAVNLTPSTPASRGNSDASAAEVQQRDPSVPEPSSPATSGILENLSVHTPDLVQGLRPLRKSGYNFPLFGTRFIPLN